MQMKANLFERLLTHGYFPRELPPTFTTRPYGTFVAKSWKSLQTTFSDKNPKALWIRHTAPRSGLARRELNIPNPVPFSILCAELTEQWSSVNSKIERSTFSTTKPLSRTKAARALLAEHPQKDLPEIRAHIRAGAKYLLETDISLFYHSIYTHSIPWVLHGKSVAKKKQGDKDLAGNRLDRALRNCHDRQTVGIPIGPDASLAVAELVLSEVDASLQMQFPRLQAMRYIDDYEIAVRSRAEGEDVLRALQRYLNVVELSVNTTKTTIRELPLPFEHPWNSELRSLPLRKTKRAQTNDLIRSFERAAEYAHKDPNEPVFRYLLGRFARVEILEQNWILYQDLLLQSLIVEPGTITAVLTHLILYSIRGFAVNRDTFEPALNEALIEHCKFARTNEITWLLWGIMILGFQIFGPTVEALVEVEDPLVALLSLHAESKGICASGLDKSRWSQFMTKDELYGERWILAYEALQRKWLPPLLGKDYVAADPKFSQFAKNGISFYNEKAIVDARPSGAAPTLGLAPLFYTG
jgi:hypothetical protein